MSHYRSRALWDETRKPNAPLTAYLRAILYELQPVRFLAVDYAEVLASGFRFVTSITRLMSSCAILVVNGIRSRSWTWRDIMTPLVIIGYFSTLKYLHQLLEAGPLFLIITALIAVFTIGLGDTRRNTGMSAYSVFNRGFRNLLGSIDAEALVDQYVGGGVAPAALPRHERQEQQFDAEGEENEDERRRDDGGGGRSRKSGKKARRKNLEKRREMQRQRRAAREMGLGEGETDIVAMNEMMENELLEVDHDDIDLLDAGFDG